MSVLIYMSGSGAEEELRSLHDWLLNEPDVRRYSRLSLRTAEVKPGEMGGALEAVQVMFEDSATLMNLLLAFAAWRGTRGRRRNEATIAVFERDGIKVTIENASPEAIEAAAKALRAEES
ncbi:MULTISPECIES: effector-associated constant component EACC1 [Actinomadura]|uniref:Uncharacterized protein n=1 Tax=Actinomadura yumaensis TaxID=111807 RepID=A0ABW2CI68_9ACTN|nr:hypothetical protein [Actinomadura sp. J1-007]MWK34714.1 hypothetical protein [Actinomadura sp. J1-007]